MPEPEPRGRARAVVAIIALVLLLGLGAMLVTGLVQGDEVAREENPVNGAPAGLRLSQSA